MCMSKRKTMATVTPIIQCQATNGSAPDRQEQLAVLAYEYWMERGCPAGSPEVDWLRAEREIQNRRTLVRAAHA